MGARNDGKNMDFSSFIVLAVEQAAEQAGESAGFIGTLGLNWKLFLAQLINFAIVLLILWKWVFKPIGGALEARRKRIDDSLRKAQEIETRMQSAEKEYEQRLRQAQAESAKILRQTQAQAESAKQETADAARIEAERILADARAAIEADKERMFAELREETANLAVMATEKILREKLDEKKDREIIEAALKSLRSK